MLSKPSRGEFQRFTVLEEQDARGVGEPLLHLDGGTGRWTYESKISRDAVAHDFQSPVCVKNRLVLFLPVLSTPVSLGMLIEHRHDSIEAQSPDVTRVWFLGARGLPVVVALAKVGVLLDRTCNL